MAAPTGNKRQRHSGETSSNSLQLLTDLPNALLPNVASFLPRISCVSFAIAMSKQSLDGTPSIISIAIATASSEKWESLDFKDIQEGIYGGRSLTDNDVRWVLLCVDASKITKSLKFTNCIGITGSGLEPIRESIVLERIDLSLVEVHENPNITPEPPISAVVVLPILEDILNTEDNSLVHAQLPKHWREARSDIMTHFIERLGRLLNERRFQCSNGCGVCEGGDSQYDGVIDMTCYQCMKHFCFECIENCEINFCKCCEKVYCNDCNKVVWCERCYEDTSCKACDALKSCAYCSNRLCSDCASWVTCSKCGEGLCNECSSTCSYCQKSYCDSCDECIWCKGPGCMVSGATQKVSCRDCDKVKICAQGSANNHVESACEDCATSEWIDCQYCSTSYCSINCGHEYVINVCQGEGCKRANCYDTHLGKYCTNGKELGAECVRRCNAWEDGCPVTERGCGTTYCTACRVKEVKRDGFDCSVCVESVASLFA